MPVDWDWSSEDLVKLFEGMKNEPDSARRAAPDAFFTGRDETHPRMYIGKSQSGAVSVRMNDRGGRERLIFEVGGNETAHFPAK